MDIETVNTILYCNRWGETVDFYKNRLGLQVTAAFEWFVEFKLNEASRLSIADAERTSIESCGGKGLTITIRVEDIEAAFSILKGAGLDPTPIKDHVWGAKVIYIRDPEGNRLEFWSQNAKDNGDQINERQRTTRESGRMGPDSGSGSTT